MELKRIFYPVGHGGFSEEIFYMDGKKILSVVYDCGTSKIDLIKKALKKRSEIYMKINNGQDTSIDWLFISHYHNDHINILKDLGENYSIKNIILPSISKFEKIYYLLEFISNKDNTNVTNENYVNFFHNLIYGNMDQNDTNIIFYPNDKYEQKESGMEREVDEIDIQEVDIENISEKLVVRNGTRLYLRHIWTYIPFYIKDSEIDEAFINELQELNKTFPGLIDENNLLNETVLIRNMDSIGKHYVNMKDSIKDSNGYKYNPHKNNLILYSGLYPKKDLCTSCLYTGDIHNSNHIIDQVVKYYDTMLESGLKGCTLVWPHHGSCTYYKEQLHGKFKKFVIFANRNGRHSRSNPCPVLRHFIGIASLILSS